MFMEIQGRRHQQLFTAARFGYVGVVKKLTLTKYVNVKISDEVSLAYV